MFINEDDEVDPAFAELMVKLASAYQSARLTELGIKVYARALSDLTLDELRMTFGRAIRECQFFPTVAELLRLRAPSVDDAGLIAWSALSKAASSVGAYANVQIEDAAAAAALLTVCGGWPQFCELEDGPAMTLKRQEFLAAYRDARRGPRSDGPARLLGICGEPSGEHRKRLWAGYVTADGRVTSIADVPTSRGRPRLVGG